MLNWLLKRLLYIFAYTISMLLYVLLNVSCLIALKSASRIVTNSSQTVEHKTVLLCKEKPKKSLSVGMFTSSSVLGGGSLCDLVPGGIHDNSFQF